MGACVISKDLVNGTASLKQDSPKDMIAVHFAWFEHRRATTDVLREAETTSNRRTTKESKKANEDKDKAEPEGSRRTPGRTRS